MAKVVSFNQGLIVTPQHRNDGNFTKLLDQIGGGMQYEDTFVGNVLQLKERVLTLTDPQSNEKTILKRGAHDSWDIPGYIKAPAIPDVDARRAAIVTATRRKAAATSAAGRAAIVIPDQIVWFDEDGNEYDQFGRVVRTTRRIHNQPEDQLYVRYDALSEYMRKRRRKRDSNGQIIADEVSYLYCPTGPVDPSTNTSIAAYTKDIAPPKCKFPKYTTFTLMMTAECTPGMSYESTVDFINLLNNMGYKLPERRPATVQVRAIKKWKPQDDDYTVKDFKHQLDNLLLQGNVTDDRIALAQFREFLMYENDAKQFDSEAQIFQKNNRRSWTYEEAFKRWDIMFKDENVKRRKLQAWDDIKMNSNQTVKEYTQHFRKAALDAEIQMDETSWTEHIRRKFFASLPREIQDLVIRQHPDSSTKLDLEPAETYMTIIDTLVNSNQNEFGNRYKSQPKQKSGKKQGKNKNSDQIAAVGTCDPNLGENHNMAMMTPKQRDYRTKHDLCFECGKAGHQARNCPTLSKAQQAKVAENSRSNKRKRGASSANTVNAAEDKPSKKQKKAANEKETKKLNAAVAKLVKKQISTLQVTEATDTSSIGTLNVHEGSGRGQPPQTTSRPTRTFRLQIGDGQDHA